MFEFQKRGRSHVHIISSQIWEPTVRLYSEDVLSDYELNTLGSSMHAAQPATVPDLLL